MGGEMTREEYNSKLKEANKNADINTAFSTMQEYIESLEARIAELERAYHLMSNELSNWVSVSATELRAEFMKKAQEEK